MLHCSICYNEIPLKGVEQEVLIDLKKLISRRDVIAGTGGFTKIRVALKSENTGKSGSTRVIYFDCKTAKRTFLVLIYSKSEFENISSKGKTALKKLAKELTAWEPKRKK